MEPRAGNHTAAVTRLTLVLFALAGIALLSYRAMAQDQSAPVKSEKPPQSASSISLFEGKGTAYSLLKLPGGLSVRAGDKQLAEIYLPGNLIAGESFTGSVKLQPMPVGSILPTVSIGGQLLPLKDGPFTAKLDDGPVTKLRVVDEKGHTLTGADLHTESKPKPLSDFWVAVSAEYGSTTDIWVSNMVDPRFHKLRVFLGNGEVPVLAASSADAIIPINYETLGLTELKIKSDNIDFKRPFRVLKLDLSADSLNLLAKQSTTVHIVVHGLENLHVSAHMKIVVTGTVTMTGPSEVEIKPSDISANGTYTTSRALYAVSAGSFGVNVTVTVDKELEVVRSNEKGESNCSRLPLSNKLVEDRCDKLKLVGHQRLTPAPVCLR